MLAANSNGTSSRAFDLNLVRLSRPTKLLVSQKSSWLSGVSTHFMHSIPLRAAHNVGACVDDLKIFFFFNQYWFACASCTDGNVGHSNTVLTRGFRRKNIGWPMGLLFRCFLTTAKKNYEIRFISIYRVIYCCFFCR